MEYYIYLLMEIRFYYSSVCLRIRTPQLLSWKFLKSDYSNICKKSLWDTYKSHLLPYINQVSLWTHMGENRNCPKISSGSMAYRILRNPNQYFRWCCRDIGRPRNMTFTKGVLFYIVKKHLKQTLIEISMKVNSKMDSD
jgi:hypothetical protein